jgi:serine/threonine protein kinase
LVLLVTQPTCPDVRNLQALLEAGASGDEPDAVVRHLETCASCQQTLEFLSADSGSWEAIAHGLGQPARREQALWQVVEQLKREEPVLADAGGHPFQWPIDQPDWPGLVGPYEVQEVIGRGGMGVVLRAFDPALNRVVALKVLAPGLAGSPTARWRFVREARAAAAVRHEHVVTVHGVSEEGDLPFLVMQYVAGESLQARLDRGGPLDVETVVRIGLQTAEGLAAAHAQGLIHRDIKPANLLLSVVGCQLSVVSKESQALSSLTTHNPQLTTTVKITDFGLARTASDVGLTQDGVVVGTPEYMAPEQARGEPVDHRADLFSLGSVLYACCTGVPPFRGSSTVAVLLQVSEQAPTPVRVRNPDVPGWLEALIDRLLAKDPTERFQSAAEVAALLEFYLAHLRQPETVPAPGLPPLLPAVPAGTPARRDGPALRSGGLLLALALAALGLGGVAWLAGDGGPDAPSRSASEVFYQDFRDKKPVVDHFFMMGTDWEKIIAPEREGLRVNLPATRKVQRTMRGIGLGTNLPVAGDFQITATYELLSAGTPASSNEAAGVDLFVQRAGFGRFNTQQGPVYEMGVRASSKKQRVPTAATKGQLRLARAGSILSYLVKDDTTQGEFKELYQTEFDTEPLKFILFEVNPGREATPVEARLIDLRIESNLPIQAPPPDPSGPPRGAGRRWLAAAGVFVLFVSLGLALAQWLYLRRRR